MLLTVPTIGIAMAQESVQNVSVGIGTRLIFHSDEKRISFPVNNNLNKPAYFHARVLEKNKNKLSPFFIVSPELVEIKPGTSKSPQIIRLGGNFAEDRETLFYLQGHFLPKSERSGENDAGLNISYSIQMKLFFRPEKLKASYDAIDDNADKLDFMKRNGKLVVTNKSPYFFTINTLRSESFNIDVPAEQSMIDPFGEIELDLPNQNIKSITWTLLNDGGFSTKPLTRKL